MPSVAADMLASKKFVFTLITTIVILLAAKYGALDKSQVLGILQLILPGYLLSQGVSDLGKGAFGNLGTTFGALSNAAQQVKTPPAPAEPESPPPPEEKS